jgi:hypothetical protein
MNQLNKCSCTASIGWFSDFEEDRRLTTICCKTPACFRMLNRAPDLHNEELYNVTHH